jgi:type I restriction enzyme, S subunit
MNTYPSYKDSGVEWIGEIPIGWDTKRFSYSFNIQKGKIPRKLINEPLEKSLPYLSMEVLRGKNPSEYSNEDGLVIVQNGDIGLLWDGSNSGEVVRINREGILSSTVSLLSLKDTNLKKEFSFYLLKFYEDDYKNNTIGMGIPHVDGNHVKESKLIIPSIDEQTQIVSFLDTKTQKIDELIEKTEQKIKLLKEKRTSLINHCVTKGLNPNVEMKESGVEWIGEIPSHWNLIKLRFYLTKVGSGVTPRGGGEVYSDEGIKFLRSQNIHFDGLHLSDVVFITEKIYEKMKNSQVNNGDVLLNITGGSIGRCCVISSDEKFNLNQHVSILRTKPSLYNYFLNYNLQSSIGQEQVLYNQTGGNREGLTSENIKNFIIGLPSKEEQTQIIEYLDEQTQKIDSTIEKETQRIELLKEYRQSLISEVVTGKVDVRDYNG